MGNHLPSCLLLAVALAIPKTAFAAGAGMVITATWYKSEEGSIGHFCTAPAANGEVHCWCTDESGGQTIGKVASDCLVTFVPIAAIDPEPGSVQQRGAPQASTTSATDTTTSTVTSVAQESSKTLGQKVNEISSTSTGGQLESLGQALEISSLGANHNATVGALFCAEGANASAEGNDGANQIASCQNSFAAAAKLAENVKKLGGKGEFMVDEKVAADPRSQNTLAQFEKHFSLRGEDYLQKMVGAHGGLLAFTEMVKEKLGPKKTEELVEAANTSSPEAPAAKTATPTRLRETLRRNLTESDALREALNRKLNQPDGLRAQAGNAHNSAPQTPRNLENLTPLETNGIFPSEDDANRGMTLFEVVHRKYTELKKRIRL